MRARATVAVLSPFVGGDYYGPIIAGVHDAARRASGRVLAIQTLAPGSHTADDSGVPDFSVPLAWDYVDGLLVLPAAVDRRYVARAKAAGKPVVIVGQAEPAEFPRVLADNAMGISAAVVHLVEHGHDRIAFGGHLDGIDVRERYEAYLDALRSYGLTPDPDLLFVAPDNHETGGAAVAAAMMARGVPATAAVLGTDRNAIGLIASLHDAGYELPHDLAVTGFDDTVIAAFAEPSVATVRQPLEELGATAYRLLARMSRGENVPPDVVRVSTEFVARESCGCVVSGPSLSDDQVRGQFHANQDLHQTLNTQYQLGIELLRTHERDPRALAWLGRTPAVGGCLGLWVGVTDDGASSDEPRSVEIAGTFQCADLDVGVQASVREFPPLPLFDVAAPERDEMVFVVPVTTETHDWGLLAAVGKIQESTPPGRELMNHSGAMLAVALEHDLMLRALREQEERLRHAALYDHLTGLPNRSLLLDRLARAGHRAARHAGERYAVLFVDVDDFKSINDTYGHAAGDDVLIGVAELLTGVLRGSDTAARLGGDEFVVLLEDMGSEQHPRAVVERIREAMSVPVVICGEPVTVSASIGVAVSASDLAEAGLLLRLADSAMYEEKLSRRRASVAAAR